MYGATMFSSSTIRIFLGGSIRLAAPGENDFEPGTGLALDFHGPAKLINERGDEPQPEGWRLSDVQIFRDANPVVSDGHSHGMLLRIRNKIDRDFSFPMIGKSVFDAIGDKLVDDQAARDGGV